MAPDDAGIAPTHSPDRDEQKTSHKDLARLNDVLQRDVAKWTKMYEDLREVQRQTETKLRDRIEELRRDEVSTRKETADLRTRLERAEANYRELVKAAEDTAETGDPAATARTHRLALVQSHAELSQSYDTLFRQMEQKQEALDAMSRARQEAEQRAEEEVRRMEERLHQERDLADLARNQYAEMEEAYHQLVRSYRDMNDRFIRLHQEKNATHRDGASGPGSRGA